MAGGSRPRSRRPSSAPPTSSCKRSISCGPVPSTRPRSDRPDSPMHELSLSGAIVNTVVKHAADRRVAVVNLRVGRLRQVVPETLDFYFEFVARGTVCEGAVLEQELIEAELACNRCGHRWTIEIPAFRCPE